jgi:aminoglycoside 3-N-acetyltransferase
MPGELASELARELRNTGIPTGRPLLAHVRLRGLSERLSASYADCAAMLLDALRGLRPPHLLVPSFTYSFTRNREYDARSTPCEVGRFAEEVRTAHARWRTPDPIFSVSDALGGLAGEDVDYGTAFGEGGAMPLDARTGFPDSEL